MILGHRSKVGVLSSNNRITANGWLISFTPRDMPIDADMEMYHATIRGPGGFFLTFLDDIQYGVSSNGKISEYAPTQAMYIRKGQEVSFHWSILTAPAPKVWIYLREPEVGRL